MCNINATLLLVNYVPQINSFFAYGNLHLVNVTFLENKANNNHKK